MTTTKQFKVYHWLIETIKENNGISLRELNSKWLDNDSISDNRPLNRKTLKRYRDDISRTFGVEIECQMRGEYKYYIEKGGGRDEDELRKWMLSTLTIKQHLEEDLSLKNRILIEHVPSGDLWLELILKAMRENRRIEMVYQKYTGGMKRAWVLSPYCLKLYNRRWYILAKTDYSSLLTFCLDRIKEAGITSETFQMDPNFDARKYFEDFYGIYKNEGSKKRRVVIRTFEDEGYYLRDLPIHHSQKIIGRGDGYVDFELKLHTNKELSAYVLSRGKRMKVISPLEYVKEIEEMRG